MTTEETALLDRTIPRHPGRTNERVIPLMFAVYLVLLAWTVLWKLHEPFIGRNDMREIKLVPFVASGGFGASAPFEVAMNLVIFVPFGVYLGMLAASWPVWRTLAASAACSVTLEAAQFLLASGSSDVTDVIVNTTGGLVGLGLIAVARRRLRARTAVVVTRFCVIGTALAVVLVGVHIASFPQLPPPGEVLG